MTLAALRRSRVLELSTAFCAICSPVCICLLLDQSLLPLVALSGGCKRKDAAVT